MSLKYLVTILYQPRETMQRILQSANRWSLQIIALAAVCASVQDVNTRDIARELPGFTLAPTLALAVIAIVGQAVGWAILALLVALLAAPIGRLLLGGTAKFRDVFAAVAWALVPAIWSLLYRVPFTILSYRLHDVPRQDTRKFLLTFVSHGGCSLVVVYIVLQLAFEIACVVLASFTVAEAQKFSTQKGFVNVIAALVFPVMVIFAAVFSLRS
ncbi:MAG TPA: YIP1 family protein [Thermoanaerobaculia bacterium]|nr:YIP1 family protein [Thermoanaerobaculia bacterium]